jgi:hypothetical protein
VTFLCGGEYTPSTRCPPAQKKHSFQVPMDHSQFGRIEKIPNKKSEEDIFAHQKKSELDKFKSGTFH